MRCTCTWSSLVIDGVRIALTRSPRRRPHAVSGRRCHPLAGRSQQRDAFPAQPGACFLACNRPSRRTALAVSSDGAPKRTAPVTHRDQASRRLAAGARLGAVDRAPDIFRYRRGPMSGAPAACSSALRSVVADPSRHQPRYGCHGGRFAFEARATARARHSGLAGCAANAITPNPSAGCARAVMSGQAKQRAASNGAPAFIMWKQARASLWANALVATAVQLFARLRS